MAKASKPSTKKAPPVDLFSVSALSDQFDLDRGTVRKRLRTEGVRPSKNLPKLKAYSLSDKGRSGRTVQDILEAADDPKLTEAKTRKMMAEAQRVELKLEIDRGELAPMGEVRDHVFSFIKAMHTRISKRYPRENARRLRRCRSTTDLMRTLEVDLSLIFDDLKRDYPAIF